MVLIVLIFRAKARRKDYGYFMWLETTGRAYSVELRDFFFYYISMVYDVQIVHKYYTRIPPKLSQYSALKIARE